MFSRFSRISLEIYPQNHLFSHNLLAYIIIYNIKEKTKLDFGVETYNNFVKDFSTILKEKVKNLEISNFVFLCIGTDRVIGDSFGPLVGNKLDCLFKNEKNIKIIGNLNNIVCIQNIFSVIEKINHIYKKPFLIAIDSTLSNQNNLGEIVVSRNSIKVASSFIRRNICVGDMGIQGVVSRKMNNPRCNFRLLQNVPLKLIMNMVDLVTQGIYDVIKKDIVE